MGNTIKLVSGFILFVVGILIAYETSVYNLIDILLLVGLVISIVGVILIVSYFVDSNADRTTNMIKEFLESKEVNSPSFGGLERKSSNDVRPLKVRKDYDDYGEYNDLDYDELIIEEYPDDLNTEYYGDSFEDNPKAVLNVVNREEKEVDLDKQLVFTPNYGRPLKVTRAPKKRQNEYLSEEIPPFVIENDKSDEIQKALLEDTTPSEPVIATQQLVSPEVPEREIKIDVNNPESLPVPKSLNSYVICNEGLITSQEAFDKLANYVNKEIMLEIPSLNDLSDRFLSHVPSIYSRVIIDEFDISDMSYMFLITSLLKQGVHIKTVPKVHTVNLITDDSHAMIISEGQNDFEYGAVYEDRNSISNIRADFEKTWSLAANLDEKILGSVGGTV